MQLACVKKQIVSYMQKIFKQFAYKQYLRYFKIVSITTLVKHLLILIVGRVYLGFYKQ